jgi:hypothetical protein
MSLRPKRKVFRKSTNVKLRSGAESQVDTLINATGEE